VFFTIAVTLRGVVGLKDASFGALVAAFPNTGFMGVPLMAALMGPAAAGPVICVMIVDLFITSSVCIAMAQAGDASGHGARQGALRALRGALSNPLPWAIAVGAVFSVAGWSLPGPVNTVVGMLADAATPVALFTIGAVLHRAGQHVHTRTPVANYLPVAVIKLVLHPLAVAFAALLLFPVPVFDAAVMIAAASLPVAGNVYILAQHYGVAPQRVSASILISTALSILTVSAVIAWVSGMAGIVPGG
jgi:predicted permease